MQNMVNQHKTYVCKQLLFYNKQQQAVDIPFMSVDYYQLDTL